ncbi:entericidin EcnA/B family protein [Primorskyibacter aestuariivivens]|nr:entericidin EcnA/B family protein [Primorskyibacter aestuariivivens]MDA7428900.1 entericidin EcnA/B family protein [Primorskyibacter aestuariivivens]
MKIRLAAMLVLLALLGACGTVEGIGRDIQDGSRTVRNWL